MKDENNTYKMVTVEEKDKVTIIKNVNGEGFKFNNNQIEKLLNIALSKEEVTVLLEKFRSKISDYNEEIKYTEDNTLQLSNEVIIETIRILCNIYPIDKVEELIEDIKTCDIDDITYGERDDKEVISKLVKLFESYENDEVEEYKFREKSLGRYNA